MVIRVTATEVQAKILSLLDDVAAGHEIEITEHGRTVARLVPAPGAAPTKARFAGLAASNADDEDLFSTGDAWKAG